MAAHEVLSKSASEIVGLLKVGAISPLELLDVLEARIAQVNDTVNALPTLCFERARDHAGRLMERTAVEQGTLAGLPVPIKDLTAVSGVRTTYGSPIFADHVPETSDILVENLELHGAVIYAKSNTPEFGAGANTFNEVFGRTLNPWDTRKSAAGSSGGAAVALATGMAWLAQGSDLGGSLRNPASFCGVCGMRPSPGRVARTRTASIDTFLGVQGPMARNVEDLALMLDAMCGASPYDPNSLPRDPRSFVEAVHFGYEPERVAFSIDLGITPVDPVVAGIVRDAAARLEAAGVTVEEAHPDFSEAHECFQTLRALDFATNEGIYLKEYGDKMKPEVIWNIEKGLKLTGEDIARAEHQRTAMFHRTLEFFETYDLLITPATIVPPYPVEQRYVEECNGQTFSNYVEWLAIAYAITNVTCPAVAIPAGLTEDELPVGLQVVGPPRGDAQALAGARYVEQVLDLSLPVPIDPRIK